MTKSNGAYSFWKHLWRASFLYGSPFFAWVWNSPTFEFHSDYAPIFHWVEWALSHYWLYSSALPFASYWLSPLALWTLFFPHVHQNLSLRFRQCHSFPLIPLLNYRETLLFLLPFLNSCLENSDGGLSAKPCSDIANVRQNNFSPYMNQLIQEEFPMETQPTVLCRQTRAHTPSTAQIKSQSQSNGGD